MLTTKIHEKYSLGESSVWIVLALFFEENLQSYNLIQNLSETFRQKISHFRGSRFQDFLGKDGPRSPYKLAPAVLVLKPLPAPQLKIGSAVPARTSELAWIC